MDQTTVAALITALPNIVIAVWVIYSYQGTIKTLLENQQKLIEQLMSLHPPQDENNQEAFGVKGAAGTKG